MPIQARSICIVVLQQASSTALLIRKLAWSARIPAIACGLLSLSSLLSGQNVTTRSFDNARTAANTNETVLNEDNVNSTNFGKLFTVDLDGQVYAQPLYVKHLWVAGVYQNVVFVATMKDSLYAINADTGALLWKRTYGTPIVTTEVQEVKEPNINASSPTGILSTPVIDIATSTMYLVYGSETTKDDVKTYAFYLLAIDIHTGGIVNDGPVKIDGTYATADTTLTFDAKLENQRASLALANGNVYIAFASHNDAGAYHGWVFAYSASTMSQVAVYSDTTIGHQGGIWMTGSAPAVDQDGNVYISTGNGNFGATPNGIIQTANSLIKLSPTLVLEDYFTPYNSATLNETDQDLGSGGVLLVPDPSNPSYTKYVLAGGKSGILYMTTPINMGEFSSKEDNVLEKFQAVFGTGTSHIHGTPVYVQAPKGPTMYVWGENDKLRAFRFLDDGRIDTTPIATSTMTAPVTHADGAMPGGFLWVTANGISDRVLWASTPYDGNACQQNIQGVLYAFNPETLQVLWSDKTNDARDEIGMFAKDVPPVVINGKLYAVNFGPLGTTGAAGQLVVYGLLK
jgi:outer membrane protein assembly factor BamB